MTPHGIEIPLNTHDKSLHTGLTPIQPEIKDSSETSEVLGNPLISEEEISTEITDLDLGDLKTSPGLAAYRGFAQENEPDRLFDLSSSLRARGQFQRALLAFERVIDSSNASPAILKEAAQGIRTLAPTLPNWSIDPTNEFSLTLQLGTSQPASPELKGALLEVATTIRKSSSDQIEITPKITTRKSPGEIPDQPITIWLSSTEEKAKQTPITNLRISSGLEEATDEISFAIFQTVRAELTSLSYPPAPTLQISGKDLLSNYITRLMWRDFARNLTEKQHPESRNQNGSN